MADKSLKAQPNAGACLFTVGMALHRAGRHEAAAKRFHESLSAVPKWDVPLLNWLGLALAHHHLKQPNEAQAWLDKAVRWMEEKGRLPLERDSHRLTLHPHDWLACLLLRREAEALLKTQPPQGP